MKPRKTISENMLAFRQYLLQRNPSIKFTQRYITYLQGTVVAMAVNKVCGKNIAIDQVTSIKELQAIYDILKNDPNNLRLHNVYSGAVSAYIKFLTGKPLRAMVNSNEN